MSPERRTIYLHVGAPKTGSTYLQGVLWASRRELRQQGITLPMRKQSNHVAVAHDVRGLYDQRNYSPKAQGALDRFGAALQRVRTPRALFSMETVGSASEEQINRFYRALAGFEIHVIITARDLARQIPSAWQQKLKRRSNASYADHLRQVLENPNQTIGFWRNQDVAQVAQRWALGVPVDQIHIVTVPPPGGPKAVLLKRFCTVIGADSERLDDSSEQPNASLSSPQAELLRRVNDALGDRLQVRRAGYNRLAKHYFAKQVLAMQTGAPLRVPQEYAADVRMISDRITAAIQADGYDVVGELTDLKPTAFAERGYDASDGYIDVSEATVAEAGVQALASMLDRRHSDLQRIAELRERLESRS